MKKILFALACMSAVLVSCQKVTFDYVPSNEDVTFSGEDASYVLDGSKIVVEIVRGVADKPLSLNLSFQDEASVFSLSSNTVDFAAGEFTKAVEVSYDLADMAPAVKYSFSISFDEKVASVTGKSTFKGSGMMPLEYEDYGTITYVQGWRDIAPFSSAFSNDPTYKLQKAKFTTNYYRIVGIYDSDLNLEFSTAEYEDDGDTYIGFDYTTVSLTPCKWFGINLLKAQSSKTYGSYGPFIFWLWPDIEASFIYEGEGPGNTLVDGTVFGLMTFAAFESAYVATSTKYDYFEVSVGN